MIQEISENLLLIEKHLDKDDTCLNEDGYRSELIDLVFSEMDLKEKMDLLKQEDKFLFRLSECFSSLNFGAKIDKKNTKFFSRYNKITEKETAQTRDLIYELLEILEYLKDNNFPCLNVEEVVIKLSEGFYLTPLTSSFVESGYGMTKTGRDDDVAVVSPSTVNYLIKDRVLEKSGKLLMDREGLLKYRLKLKMNQEFEPK